MEGDSPTTAPMSSSGASEAAGPSGATPESISKYLDIRRNSLDLDLDMLHSPGGEMLRQEPTQTHQPRPRRQVAIPGYALCQLNLFPLSHRAGQLSALEPRGRSTRSTRSRAQRCTVGPPAFGTMGFAALA